MQKLMLSSMQRVMGADIAMPITNSAKIETQDGLYNSKTNMTDLNQIENLNTLDQDAISHYLDSLGPDSILEGYSF
jgi:hypothetical protein